MSERSYARGGRRIQKSAKRFCDFLNCRGLLDLYIFSVVLLHFGCCDSCTWWDRKPLIIGHRGSPGILPEHTVEGYQLAVEQGADVIECDVAVSKDLKLLCAHESWMNETTDVRFCDEFKDRVQTYYVPEKDFYRTDWFTIDFTLEELLSLTRVQVYPFRNHAFDGKFNMASFDDYIAVAKNASRTIIVYVETKNPAFFNNYLQQFNTSVEDLLLDALRKHGYTQADSPAFIESFSIQSLRYMSKLTDLPLVYLTENATSSSFMSHISKFITVICPKKNFIVEVDPATNTIVKATDFVKRAKSAGLQVHCFTFRNENQFLAFDYGADPYKEYSEFVKLQVDGMFTDFPWSLHNYLYGRGVEACC